MPLYGSGAQMPRPSCTILLLIAFQILASSGCTARPGSRSSLCTIPLTRVIKIPIVTLSGEDTRKAGNSDAANLLVSTGAADELPEGPASFDAFDDGSLLIADPLRSRLVLFDSQGNFRRAWHIGFSADSIKVSPDGFILAREANTGELHVFDREGRPQPVKKAVLPEPAKAQVFTGQNRGTVLPNVGGTDRSPLTIQFEKPGLTLLSLESLTTDVKGDTYVALESTPASPVSEEVNVNKYVRRYSASGQLLCEISDIPLDYYVPPIDELRVHKGVVFQLQTVVSEVRINEWDTNPLCSSAGR